MPPASPKSRRRDERLQIDNVRRRSAGRTRARSQRRCNWPTTPTRWRVALRRRGAHRAALPEVQRRPRLQPGLPAAPAARLRGRHPRHRRRADRPAGADAAHAVFPAPCCAPTRTRPTRSASSSATRRSTRATRSTRRPLFQQGGVMGAVDLHARASADFEAKLAETTALLQRAAAEFSPVTQASSLGAEDVVITHLINRLELDIPVFVLDTGMLHPQTLELLERTRATSRAPVNGLPPGDEAGDPVRAAAKARTPCTRASSCARPAATSARWSRWSAPWPAARLDHRPAPRAVERARRGAADRSTTKPGPAASSSIPWPTGPGATSGTTSAATGSTTTRCTTSSIPASAARPAPARSAWARISAPAAGGGRTRPPRNAACT